MDTPSILIVDDEDTVRTALVRWFTLQGFRVEEAIDGIDAIEKFGAGTFDIVTMDLEMPRMDGLEALREIRNVDAQIPIIIVTGYPHDSDVAMLRGAYKVLQKPLRLRDLEDEVREAIAASQH